MLSLAPDMMKELAYWAAELDLPLSRVVGLAIRDYLKAHPVPTEAAITPLDARRAF